MRRCLKNASVLSLMVFLLSMSTHADYESEREALDRAIQEIVENRVSRLLLYERDTTTDAEVGDETAQRLATEFYGGYPISMPIHLARSLQANLEPDPHNLSTSMIHDFQDWIAILDAATEAGLSLETCKDAEGRTAGGLFNALAGPPEENAQLPEGWELEESIDSEDIDRVVELLIGAYFRGNHTLEGVVLRDPQCQLGQAVLAPDWLGAGWAAIKLALPGDKAWKAVEMVVTGEVEVTPLSLLELGAEILWGETAGAVVAVGGKLFNADFIVAGSRRSVVALEENGSQSVRQSQVEFQANRLDSVVAELETAVVIQSSGWRWEEETRRQEVTGIAQTSYVSQVVEQCAQDVRFYDELYLAHGILHPILGAERPNSAPVIEPIRMPLVSRGGRGACDVIVRDWDTDQIEIYLSDDSRGMLRDIESRPGYYLGEYIFFDTMSQAPSVFFETIIATDNRSDPVETTFTVNLYNLDPHMYENGDWVANGIVEFDALYASTGASIFTMDPAWYEAGCLQFRDLDGDSLTFQTTQMAEFGTVNPMVSGSNGNYYVTVMYEVHREEMLACHREGRDLIDHVTIQASDDYGGVCEAEMVITFEVINTPPVCLSLPRVWQKRNQ